MANGSKTLRVDVVSPGGVLWTGEATYVAVPAVQGELGVLPGREPILAVLQPGVARVTSGGSTVEVEVHGGFVSVDDDVVTVVVSEDEGTLEVARAAADSSATESTLD